MATNLNRPVVKLESVKPVVGKPSVHPVSKPQARPAKSKPSSHGLPWEMTAPEAWDPKILSVDECMGHLSNAERLTIELERFGHFMVDAKYHWTQTEVDAEWDRLNALKEAQASTQPSPAFVLNRDFNAEPEPEQNEEVDEQDLLLPFQYKPDPNNEIDWEAIRAQPRSRVEDSPACKATVLNLKKRKSEEDLEEDHDVIKNKYQALQGKYTFFQFIFFSLINLFYFSF